MIDAAFRRPSVSHSSRYKHSHLGTAAAAALLLFLFIEEPRWSYWRSSRWWRKTSVLKFFQTGKRLTILEMMKSPSKHNCLHFCGWLDEQFSFKRPAVRNPRLLCASTVSRSFQRVISADFVYPKLWWAVFSYGWKQQSSKACWHEF